MSVAFVITSLAIVATPGTGAILTISAGLARGHRTALITALGCTLGILPHLAAAISGTAGPPSPSRPVATGPCCSSTVNAMADTPVPVSTTRTILNAVLANLLNPKLTLFFFAFLPQFVTRGSGELAQMLTLSGIFMAMTLVVFAGYGWFAAAMRHHVITRPHVVRRLQRFFSLSYLALGAKLATVER